MKFGPVTKIYKKNVKKINDDIRVNKLECYCHFSNLWLIWSNAEAGF